MLKWTLEMRKALQAYLRQGYTMTDILEMWSELGGEYSKLNFDRISKEVRRGLTEEQHKKKRYVKYDICRAYESIIGMEAIDYLKTHEIEEEDDE